MKHGTAINCIEFNGGNTYKAPPAADPNDNNLNLEVKVYKLNPDGSKGKLIRTDPAYPEGWDNPRAILPQKPKKEEENIMIPRKDRDEIVATAKKLMTEGKSMTKAAEILKIPLSTLATWLSLEKKKQQKNDNLKNNNNKPLNENDKLKNANEIDFKMQGSNDGESWTDLKDLCIKCGKPFEFDEIHRWVSTYDGPYCVACYPTDEPYPELVNYGQVINQLTLSFIFDIYDSDLAPVDKLGLIAKQIKVWEEL